MKQGTLVKHKEFGFLGRVAGTVKPGWLIVKSDTSDTLVEAPEDKWLLVPEVGEPTDPAGKEAGDVIGKTFHG